MKPIASRRFTNTRTGKPIVASVYAPRRISDDEWRCRLVIHGLPERHQHDVPGVDSLQALFEAIQGIRFYLARSGLPITLEGGEVGDYGIYRSLAGFSVAMTRRLERLVEREITKLVRSMHPRLKKRRGANSRT